VKIRLSTARPGASPRLAPTRQDGDATGPEPSQSPGRRRSFLMSLRPYFRQVSGLLVIGSAAGIMMNVAIVLPAVFLGRAINTVLAFQRHEATGGQVAEAAVLFVVATAATQVPRIGKRYWLGVARTRFQANVRADALRGVLAWPMDRLAAMSVGGVMARVIGDVQVLGLGVGEVIVETWDTLLFSLALIVTMFLYSPDLAALSLASVPPALLLAKLAGRLVARRTTDARQSDADLTTVLHEQLHGFRLLRLAGRTAVAEERVHALADRQAQAELAAIRLDEALSAVYTTLLSAGVVFVVWIGGREVAAGTLTVGGLIAFLQLFVRFAGRAPRIPQMVNRVQAAGAAYVRLEPLVAPALPVSADPAWSSYRSTHVAGIELQPRQPVLERRSAARLKLDGVTFAYPGSTRAVLTDLSLEVPAGSLVAVTGAVGSGKSALARLAAGIYAPDTGRVLIDDQSAVGLEPAERATLVGYVGQDPHLFSGTVADNVMLGTGAPMRADGQPAAQRAVALAVLTADVAAMPDGLDTEIGELGVRVSGGQRQRIALARALGAGGHVPALLVLDDPFSNVDVATEAAIISGLREAIGPAAPVGERASILLLSHRLAAFPYAERVIVLEGGRVEEQGTHGELLAAGGLYAQIFRAQARLIGQPAGAMRSS
jgi:ATP-binding cassette subfamily B multidrug efflux pump